MSVYGGLEYTEAKAGPGATFLHSYPGTGAPGAPVPRDETMTIGAEQIGFYHVAPADLAGLAGARRDTGDVLRDGRVRLTADTITAEWVIEGHGQAGLTVDAMMANMRQDIAGLIGLRRQLRNRIIYLRSQFPGDHIIMAPSAPADLRAAGLPRGLFEYGPGEDVTGSAQITVQYENLQTITRINKLNASKYLPGTKIEPGHDAAMAAGTLSPSWWRQSGFGTAQTLLDELTRLARPVVAGGLTLTQDQVGLIMLMVMNDALAATMRRYADTTGEAEDKNIQRFFPKSRRPCYVEAVTQAAVPAPTLGALRTELNRTAAAAAQLEWDLCDPFALDLRGAATELLAGNGDPAIPAGWAVIQRQGMTGGQVSNPERARVKNAVLGVGAATLAAWIGRATRAYTDATVGAADHYGAGGNGNVILSEAFTPVAGGVHGAVYEFREREVEMAMGRTDAVTGTLATLFGAA